MLLVPKENLVQLNIPLFLELCPAGFPSPALFPSDICCQSIP